MSSSIAYAEKQHDRCDVYFESIEKVQELYLHSFVQRTLDLFGAKRETVVLNEDIKSGRELSESSAEHV